MVTKRITPAEVRESKHKPVAWSADDLADQMEADEKRAKGRVLVPVETWQRPVDGKYVACLMFWDERDVGDTTEEAVTNLQRALDVAKKRLD